MIQRRPSVAARQKTDDTVDTCSPPWEKELPSVPYMAPSASPLSSAEREALPALWAAKHNDQTHIERFTDSPQTLSPSENSPDCQQGRPNGSWSPRLRGSHEAPPKSTSGSTTGISVNMSTASSNATGDGLHSIDEYARVQPFPGTMSTRHPYGKTNSRGNRDVDGRVGLPAARKQNQGTLTKRLRTTLQGIFKRTPVDESMFERIEDHHWTEEQSPI